MAGIATFLPQPQRAIPDPVGRQQQKPSTELVSTKVYIPPYGERQDFYPRMPEDFGDGGSFPEVELAQFPLAMGKKRSSSNALAVRLDADGQIKYEDIAKQGRRDNQIVYAKFADLLPKSMDAEAGLAKPADEEVEESMDRTRQALEAIVHRQTATALPVQHAEQPGAAQYVRYTPSQQGAAYASGSKQRIIKMVEAQRDPMEPGRFKMNTKIPRGPPSPPAPVMHSPPRKLTAKDQQDWKIPPAISNWKNHKGYAVPLDKRLAADGRSLQQVHINPNFNKLAEALHTADRKAREHVEMRAKLEKQVLAKQKEQKEMDLKDLAKKARDERAGIRTAKSNKEVTEEERERDEYRKERERERARERNLARAAPDKRQRIERERERDISEMIALNVPNPKRSAEDDFDQRLFNQTKGLASGFGDEDDYAVYDRPWRTEKEISNSMYRPGKNLDKEAYGGDIESLVATKRFHADKGFSGTEGTTAARDGPVQFEKEDDPFGLDKFLNEAKQSGKEKSSSSTSGATKRSSQSGSSHHHHSDDKRRK